MSLKLPFGVSFSVLFITIQYAVFRKSFRTFYVSLYIYIYDDKGLHNLATLIQTRHILMRTAVLYNGINS